MIQQALLYQSLLIFFVGIVGKEALVLDTNNELNLLGWIALGSGPGGQRARPARRTRAKGQDLAEFL